MKRILSLILLIFMHPPILLNENFSESLHEFFFPTDLIIIGGDFNCYESNINKLNGNVSRQGDPLLYVLCVEVVAIQIIVNSEIKGFLLPGAKGAQFKVR